MCIYTVRPAARCSRTRGARTARTERGYLAQADPAGILPKWLVNLCAARQASNVERLADIYRDGSLRAREG